MIALAACCLALVSADSQQYNTFHYANHPYIKYMGHHPGYAPQVHHPEPATPVPVHGGEFFLPILWFDIVDNGWMSLPFQQINHCNNVRSHDDTLLNKKTPLTLFVVRYGGQPWWLDVPSTDQSLIPYNRIQCNTAAQHWNQTIRRSVPKMPEPYKCPFRKGLCKHHMPILNWAIWNTPIHLNALFL